MITPLLQCLRASSRLVPPVLGVSVAATIVGQTAIAAGVLPQGGHYAAGAGNIAGQNGQLVITQPGSTRGVIDWKSFSIGTSNAVVFNNGTGATLNRVTGGSPSEILGRLSATGGLYVINPQGIVVGPSGVVTTGGRFVASTLDVANDAFMKNSGALTLAGKTDDFVINLGSISSSGGDVFLIAQRAVINAGSVKAPKGTAELAVGEKVLLRDSKSSKQVFVQTGSDGVIVNKGRIDAAQIDLQAADGNVYALAGEGTRVRATGTATRDGHVWLVAGDGKVTQRGVITAKNADGSGGTVDTQAAQLAFGDNAEVHAAQWNIATPSITVRSATAHALQDSLGAGTSVALTTTGGQGTNGDLAVSADMRWKGAADLTLAGYRNVSIAPHTTLRNAGSGSVVLRADASAIDNGGSVKNGGTIDWSKSTGTVSAFYDMTGSFTRGTIRANGAWKAPVYSGLVGQVTAYKLVNTPADLDNVVLDLAGNYALGKDIAANRSAFGYSTQIGSVATPFTGQFDGMGRTVTNLNSVERGECCGPEGYAASGMFRVIGPTGVVRNVNVDGSAASSGGGFNGAVGVLAGLNQGTIVNAHSSGYASGTLISSGGLVGENAGLIIRSSSSASARSDGNAGGLVAVNDITGVISQSYATGDVEGYAHTDGSGGLVDGNAGTITQSYATGSASFSPNYCGFGGGTLCATAPGALVRINTETGKITQSFATGMLVDDLTVTEGPPPGGIAFENDGVIGKDVYWNKQTTGAPAGVTVGNTVPASQGRTTAQMSQTASFGPTYNFGTNGVWAMPAGATHPVLRWQTEPF
ncbi:MULTISPECIES: filamentous hemagglutinin N-terminal domain-containing protein [unclassified Caballeronia]|uniref:two-partner secretion domain-containing protein n=1 Tax=unclassified Caballeronia TaxID=2646786 RepID=UPI0028551745|nr:MULTISPECIES: filamentous hemagglutinin N-terminal domain-containing protein [unclassified Caballeronia]MDR5774548.1 filamentous hemagglutinin N-terminal domain-containing protein [Caballeronia sp. LZ002]MDR5849984.1 filamentous hemagglutinin N-terminal domain-containing protein [Caballeronia sp. LZ003]